MKKIVLTKGKFTLVDDEDFEALSMRSWQFGSHGYAASRKKVRGKAFALLMHREIMGAKKGESIDHKNGDRLDNRRQNLRRATPSEQMRNAKGKGAVLKGAYKKRNKWRSSIFHDGKNHNLGTFGSAVEAHSVYCIEAALRFGEFARFS